MLSPRQKELRAAQDDDMRGDVESIFEPGTGLIPKVGDLVAFTDTPEFNGVVYKISTDQWKNVYIDYGVPGRSHILLPNKLKQLVVKGKCTITRPEKAPGSRTNR